MQEFEGTSEEVSIMVAHCEASIAGGYVAGALQRLKSVPATSPHYVRACVAMAEIYLKHRKDSAAYIKCYLHLVVRWHATTACTVMLGALNDPRSPGLDERQCQFQS